MQLTLIGSVELHYTRVEFVETVGGGHYVGTMEGTLTGERVSGTLFLANTPRRRGDDINLPTASGLLTTHDGARIHTEWHGIALLRPSDQARIFTASATFETASPSYAWLARTFGVIEGVLDTTTMTSRAKLHACVNEMS